MPTDLPDLLPGWVWLVGAGPGEPGLMTLLGAKALAEADVVVHDSLVDPRLLRMARDGARLVHAGKRGGTPSPAQPDISARLVREARAGARVLRLKGGDPLVFGRGAEEALALVAAGIPFRIVPGITAGIGGLAYAGIPATHRTTNAAITFITGHGAGGDEPGDLDWDAIARGSPAIVLYMALKRIGLIAERLVAAGRSPGEPAAIISRAASRCQRVHETTLGGLADAARTAETPAVIAVGEMVRLRAGLDWVGAMTGRTLLSDPFKR